VYQYDFSFLNMVPERVIELHLNVKRLHAFQTVPEPTSCLIFRFTTKSSSLTISFLAFSIDSSKNEGAQPVEEVLHNRMADDGIPVGESHEARLERVRSRRLAHQASTKSTLSLLTSSFSQPPAVAAAGFTERRPETQNVSFHLSPKVSVPEEGSPRGGGGYPRNAAPTLAKPSVTNSRDAALEDVDNSRESDREAARIEQFQRARDSALASLEVSSLPSFGNNSFDGLATLRSNLQGNSFAGGDPTALAQARYQKAKQKSELFHLQLWFAESRDAVASDEAERRAELISRFHSHAMRLVGKVGHQLTLMMKEVDDLHAATRDPSRKMLQLLNEADGLAAANGAVQEAGLPQEVVSDEMVSMLLESYARHRDRRDADMEAEMERLRSEASELRQALQQKELDLRELAAKSDEVLVVQLAERSERQKDWTGLKTQVESLEAEKVQLMGIIAQYEGQLKSLREQVGNVSRKELELVQACKEGETKLLASVVDRYESEIAKLEDQLRLSKAKKDAYRRKCEAMEAIQEEVLRGRAMIQAEILELQEAKRNATDQYRHALSNVRVERTKEKVQRERERAELVKLQNTVRHLETINSPLAADLDTTLSRISNI
jgi:hypothetical protein